MRSNTTFAIDDVVLPGGETVPVASLCRFIKKRLLNCGVLMHLQGVRRGDTSLEKQYLAGEEQFVATLVDNAEHGFTHLISPPSRFPFAVRYRERFHSVIPDAVDLTGIVRRREGGVHSGDTTTVDELIRDLTVEASSPSSEPISLLIVDDVFQSGNTVTAILTVLRRAGFVIEAVAVACPLRIVV